LFINILNSLCTIVDSQQQRLFVSDKQRLTIFDLSTKSVVKVIAIQGYLDLDLCLISPDDQYLLLASTTKDTNVVRVRLSDYSIHTARIVPTNLCAGCIAT
jgi:hypothetical protein